MNFVDVYIPLPRGVYLSKQLEVHYTRDTLRVAVKATKQVIVEGKLFGPLRVDDATWTIIKPDGVHEKDSDSDDDDSSADEDTNPRRKKVLHLELAKFDNDQITKELKKGFWLGVFADGPLMKEPKAIPPDYYDTWLDDKEAGRLWGDGAREDNRKFK